MSTNTTNLQLTKQAGSEYYSIDIVNANLDKIDAGCVNVSQAQRITGDKTFSKPITVLPNDGTARCRCLNTSLIRGTIPSADTVSGGFSTLNNNQDTLMGLNHTIMTSGAGRSNWFVRDYANSNYKEVALFSGGYLIAPNRTYNASNTSDVVTIGSLQASTDVVHTSGNETIAGQKTFTSPGVSFKTTSNYNSIPIGSTTMYNTLAIRSWDTTDTSKYDEDYKLEVPYSTSTENNFALRVYAPRATKGDTDETQTRLSYVCYVNRATNSGYAGFGFQRNDGSSGSNYIARYNGTQWYNTADTRTYNASNTSDVVTIGSLQASTDVVHTTGNETIDGNKLFLRAIQAQIGQGIRFSTGTYIELFETNSAVVDSTLYVFYLMVAERGSSGISRIAVTTGTGSIASVTSTNFTFTGNYHSDFKFGADLHDGKMRVIVSTTATNKYFVSTIFGAYSGTGFALSVKNAIPASVTVESNYVQES